MNTLTRHINNQKILPLFYHSDATVCLEVVKALYASGIRVIEFTNRGGFALENFSAIVRERNQSMKDLVLAAGTIRSVEDVHAFVGAGADFLISPFFDASILAAAQEVDKLWIPGCMTPTEIHTAELAGCHYIKLFPGHVLAASFVSTLNELFPTVEFIITGGVEPTKENLQSWFASGASAVGIGSKLLPQKLLDSKDYSAVENDTRNVLKLLQTIAK